MILRLTFLLFIVSHILIAQVNFNNEKVLIDETQYTSEITEIACEDINNDGYKELFIASYSDFRLSWYKNVKGNLLYSQRRVISSDLIVPRCICIKDLNNDGFKDVVAAAQYDDKVVWYKNLGNEEFSTGITIGTAIDNPQSIIVEDLDNDGDNDIVVGVGNVGSVIWFENTGHGKFKAKETILSIYRITKVIVIDINNDGLKDIVSASSDGLVNWSKNLGNGNFSETQIISYSAAYEGSIATVDVNNDGFQDIITSSTSNDKVECFINQSGESFSPTITIDDSNEEPYQIKIADMDNDSIDDIVVSYWSDDKIGWYKNFGDTSFSSLHLITNNLENPKSFIIEDINNDTHNDLLTTSLSYSDMSLQKLAYYQYIEEDVYTETILSFYVSAVCAIKTADLNNDGYQDIVSGFSSIVWNKNLKADRFSSYMLISDSINTNYVFDIEIRDLDNDNDSDIVAVVSLRENDNFSYRLYIYENLGNENFKIICSQPLSNVSREVELTDINGDGLIDILFTYAYGGIDWEKNLDGKNFGPLTAINIPELAYSNNKIKCGDIDNDGDIDILANSETQIQWLENDGTGTFNYHPITSGIYSSPLLLDDLNNDGYLDIISAGDYSYGPDKIYWIKNINGVFSGPIIIDNNQSAKDLFCADINNDGLKDIIGVSYEYYSPYDEKLYYYLQNNSAFDSQSIIDNLGTAASLTRNLYIADLNNDNKLDIVTSYYYMYKVGYYMQTYPTTLREISICQGDSSYAEGNEQTITGKYYDIFPNNQGFDSILITNLKVIPTLNEKDITICQGDFYYAGGNEQTEPGVYYDTLKNSLGCDSLAITWLQINTGSEIFIDTTICQGELYSVGRNEHAEPGVYCDTLQNLFGCDSIVTTQLEIKRRSEALVDTTISLGNSYYAGGMEQIMPGIYYDTLQNSIGCDSIVTTNLSYTGIKVLSIEKEITIFPVPTIDYLNIQLINFDHVQFFNQTGQLISESDKKTINVSNLNEGVYYLKIFDSKNILYMKKIVIIR